MRNELLVSGCLPSGIPCKSGDPGKGVQLKERVVPCLLKRIITFKGKITSCSVINSTHPFCLWGDIHGNLEVPKLISDRAPGEFPG